LPVATVQGNPSLQMASLDITNVKCRGEASGVITVNIQGGRAPYKYEWNNRISNRSINNLKAGQYTLRVSDSDSCKMTFGPFSISEPANGILVNDTISSVVCNGGSTGGLAIGLSGGKAPYRWSWQNAQGQVLALDLRRLSNLRAGAYSLLVSDSDNCSLFFTYTVPQPDPVRVAFEVVSPKGELANGSLKAKPSGGTPPYRYRWNNGTTSESLTGISVGTYSVVVTDSKNCQTGETIVLKTTSTIDFSVLDLARIYPNPTVDALQLELRLKEALPIEVQLLDLTGKVIWRRRLGQQLNVNERISLQDLPAGTYALRVNAEGKLVYLERVAKMGN